MMNYLRLFTTIFVLSVSLSTFQAAAGSSQAQAARNQHALEDQAIVCADDCKAALSNCHAEHGHECQPTYSSCSAACKDPDVRDQAAKDYSKAHNASTYGTCSLTCDKTLAACQSKGHKRCPRTYQFCIDDCKSPPGKPKLSKKEQRLRICQQRCDHSASTCAEARPNDPGDCDRGRLQCHDRCGP